MIIIMHGASGYRLGALGGQATCEVDRIRQPVFARAFNVLCSR